MRTTLTLEDDVAARVAREMRQRGVGLKSVVNEALRRGLGIGKPAHAPEAYVIKHHRFGFHAWVDRDRMNQLADELETDAILEKLTSGK
jgi:hypothetical protein